MRHVSWIMDSIERLTRRNDLELSGIFGFDAGGTVYTRVNRLATSDGMVGYALDALREAYFGEYADRLLLVGYEALVRDPPATLAAIYDFIGEAPYPHDFENIEYDAEEFDTLLGTPGLHRVRGKVEPQRRVTVLPPDLFERFQDDAFWVYPEANVRNVRVLLPAS